MEIVANILFGGILKNKQKPNLSIVIAISSKNTVNDTFNNASNDYRWHI